jgi:DNA polymerase III delta subunit
MIYLLLGEDQSSKDKKISEIKHSLLKQPEAVFFDFETLDAIYLNAASFKKSLIALPAFSLKRLLLIRNAHRIKKDVAQLLEAFSTKEDLPCDIILETSEALDGLLKDLSSFMKVFAFGIKTKLNIFDMTKLMSMRKSTESLKMLNDFYDQGMYPLQMMGALVWYWGKEGKSLGPARFEKGLKALEEADLNIKRSRLIPEYALEKLVVELIELQKG